MRFDLTDLRLFLAVTEHGSLTRAAAVVNLSLASVSERIAGMEALLGARLLERNRRGVRPTPAGEALTRHVRLILDQVERMRGELRGHAGGFRGRLRLLVNTAALITFLPDRLAAFLSDYPDLSLDLEERPSREIVLALAEGRAELGIVADSADLAALQARPLTQDRLVVVTSTAHRLAGRSSIAFDELLDEAFVGLADAALERHLADQAARLGRQLHYRVQLRSPRDLLPLLLAGVGIAILPEASAAAASGLTTMPLAEPWALRRLQLCARDFTGLTPQASLLAASLLGGVATAA